MKPILILKMGQTIPDLVERKGDFEDWIARPFVRRGLPVEVLSPNAGTPLPQPNAFAGILISGSHAMVTDRASWSEHTAEWIPEIVFERVPLLGICYGHQLIAHALGGMVGQSPGGMEIGTINLHLTNAATDDLLFGDLPVCFSAHVSHFQSVVELPPKAKRLAFSAVEAHHAFCVGSCAWGVQFHPEFDVDIMKAYIHAFDEMMHDHGQRPEKAIAAVTETPRSREILDRFADIVLK